MAAQSCRNTCKSPAQIGVEIPAKAEFEVPSGAGEEFVMARGTVKWFDAKKGYGFILDEESGKDIFVHFSALQMGGFRTLNQGQAVEYQVVEGSKGLQASNVTIV